MPCTYSSASLTDQATMASPAPSASSSTFTVSRDMAPVKADLSAPTPLSEYPLIPTEKAKPTQKVKKKRKTLEHLIDVDQRKFRESTLLAKLSPALNELNEVCY